MDTKLEEFIKFHKDKFYKVEYVLKRLKDLPKNAFIYITNALKNEEAKAFRKALKDILRDAGYTNVVLNDEIFEVSPYESDYTQNNSLMFEVCRSVHGLVIELNYEEFGEWYA